MCQEYLELQTSRFSSWRFGYFQPFSYVKICCIRPIESANHLFQWNGHVPGTNSSPSWRSRFQPFKKGHGISPGPKKGHKLAELPGICFT